MKKIDIKGIALKVGGIGAGAYAAVKIDKIAFVGNLSPMVRGIGKVALGALLPVIAKQKPGSILEHVGNGLISIGALQLASKFDTSISIAGLGELPSLGQVYYDEAYTAGVGASSTLGSDDVLSYE
ncbi:MAG: hypothetical protein ABIQ88_02365 [Chitinophagaceae bacterium]